MFQEIRVCRRFRGVRVFVYFGRVVCFVLWRYFFIFIDFSGGDVYGKTVLKLSRRVGGDFVGKFGFGFLSQFRWFGWFFQVICIKVGFWSRSCSELRVYWGFRAYFVIFLGVRVAREGQRDGGEVVGRFLAVLGYFSFSFNVFRVVFRSFVRFYNQEVGILTSSVFMVIQYFEGFDKVKKIYLKKSSRE